MSRKKSNMRNLFRMFLSALIAAIMTFSLSSAKFTSRFEYTLKLSMAQHYTFSPGTSHTFEVPRDGYYAFKLRGANGGDSASAWDTGETYYPYGGQGGEVSAVSYFTKGTVLVVTVGSKGGTNIGGYNGGGNGGTDNANHSNFYAGGGGGGATDIRSSGGTLGDRLLVAGGGGGASAGNNPGHTASLGGNGGVNQGNYAGANGAGAGGGEGGGDSGGGDGYVNGDAGIGGGGAYSGGGGGGGYYGGGGAYGSSGGGGGGSAYISPGFSAGVPAGLPQIGDYAPETKDGYAIISYIGNRAPDIRGAAPNYMQMKPLPPQSGEGKAPAEVAPAPMPTPKPIPETTDNPDDTEIAPETDDNTGVADETDASGTDAAVGLPESSG